MITVGSQEGEHVLIKNLVSIGDGGWCQAEVHVRVNGFMGSISPCLEQRDFTEFYQQLVKLNGELKGHAELKPIEGQFSLVLSGDGKGHIGVKGVAYSFATYGSCLKFEFEIDQTYLPGVIGSLRKLLEAHDT